MNKRDTFITQSHTEPPNETITTLNNIIHNNNKT